MLLALTALFAIAAPPKTGPDETWFPFVIPWNGIHIGSAPDVSFLNDKPAGKNGFIVVKNGHFVTSKTGKRIRFLGVNITARQAFPTKHEAEVIAQRLAQLGINVVRFHHLQQTWDKNGMIWKKGREHLDIDPAQLDKLDYFVSQLKKNGIYANINLQTTREYQPEQGFPDSVKDIPFGFSKRIDKVDRKMIALQKEYAKQLLGRVNPYTKLAYKDEPALVMVEINNENSLVGDPWDGGLGRGLDALPTYFKNEVVALWNRWLIAKYKTDTALSKAWSLDATPLGPSMTTDMSNWHFENHSNGDVKFSTEKSDGNTPTLIAEVNNNPGPAWHVQANVIGLNFKNDQVYTVKFRARSDRYRSMQISVMLDQDDWHSIGLVATTALNDAEKEYRYTFKARDSVANHARVTFILGATTGTVWISHLTIQPGNEGGALQAGESLTKANIGIPESDSDAVHFDWVTFLYETEKNYSGEMRAYLRKDLGLKANLVDTQVSWGGTTGINREMGSDYIDNHSYWQHPSFPNKPWDGNDWMIPNTPMIDDLQKEGGTVLNLASTRVWNKPYTISEYNHPAPNDYQVEMMPVISSFAALQDWDAVFGFDYGTTLEGEANDKIESYFGLGTNPAKMAFYPTAALIFRLGLVPEATGLSVLELGDKPWQKSDMPAKMWLTKGPIPDWTTTRVAVSPQPVESKASRTEPTIKVAQNGEHLDYLIEGEKVKGVVGFVGGRTINLTNMSFDFKPFDNGFGACVIASLDDKPLSESKRMLISLGARVENQSMGWNTTRTSVGSQWGKGPTMAQTVVCTMRLKTNKQRKVYVLAGDGKPRLLIPTTFENGRLTFTLNDTVRSMWFEIGE